MNKYLIFNKYWFYYFLVKVFYMFFVIFIYSKIAPLADSDTYLNGSRSSLETMFYSSTSMMGVVSSMISNVLGSMVTHFFFMCISFYGIYYSVNKLILTKKQFISLLIIVSMPSFNIWTSIVGKEAVAVFFMGILAGYLIDYYYKPRLVNKIEVFAFYLGFIFKAWFMPPILLMIFFLKIRQNFMLRGLGQFMLLIIIIFCFGSVVWYFKDYLNELTFIIPHHFNLDGLSTRQIPFWQNDFDFIWKAPEGMFISFVGPTLTESLHRIKVLPSFLEGIIIFSIFIYFIFMNFNFIKYKKTKINILTLASFSIIFIGILLFSYPLGVSNYSSAIRYREAYYGFLVVMFYHIIITKYNYKQTKRK